ncbi:hypothetical protein BS50DRAFT_574055 [Corynespora cassiicola Philippines]|uniref:Integral membrane protein n=1 Tax=Corynespora cassiicola Philippines TaxID=1448308 RepID=A0A2T2NPI2_CORCC|nr:hypothetical protein BS50DRAFT_574055 [Corynespora cassiicola Philippines]
MFEHFSWRHLPPLLLATTITIGGTMPWTHGPTAALLKFGFPQHIADSKAAWPIIKVGSARVSTIGIALWGMYLGGEQYLGAMDILIASMGWMAFADTLVCSQEGAPGSAKFRGIATSCVALWGLLGMTSGKYF